MIETPPAHATQTPLANDAYLTRRRFLKMGSFLAASLFLPQSIYALPRLKEGKERRLKLFNTHTLERLDICYHRNNEYRRDVLRSVNYLLRDHRTGEVHPIDLHLLDIMHAIQSASGRDSRLHIISGYRSPTTNARLRRRSRGVARKSLHMLGHAADIRIPGIPTAKVRRMALELGMGGVGYYPRSDFVHIDIGPVRTW
ncbi:MAG: DUF882 domain-containing protein [Desulfobacterales bacterium]|jgi:uncharacterized protein YcbK (DUF882 family)